MEFFEEQTNSLISRPKKRPLGLLPEGEFIDLTNPEHPWGFRGISARVCERYGVSVIELEQGGHGLILPAYNEQNELVAQKLRSFSHPKGFWFKASEDAIKIPTFFGQHLFSGPSNKVRSVAITFGELDALAASEMLGDWPIVSVAHGDQSAKKTFAAQYSWLDKWDEIILIPDNDESCKAVLPELCQMFMRKIRIVSLTKHKDPCDYLKAGEQKLFRNAYWSAQPWKPEKLVSMAEIMADTLFTDPPEPIADYPWPTLNEMLGGVFEGDIVAIKAPPGVGKTTFTTSIAHSIMNTQPEMKIGLIYLEETKRDLAFRFATLELNKNLQRKDVRSQVTKEELSTVLKKYQENDQITVVDHGDTCSTDFLEEKFKELVLARGCKIVVFDHISMAIADESNADERIALDRALYMMRSLVNGGISETKPDGSVEVFHPSLLMVTHVNDQGKTRGSRATLQVCNVMLSLQRDPVHDDPAQRNIVTVMVEKNRRLGETGPGCVLFYNKLTGCLEDRSETLAME